MATTTPRRRLPLADGHGQGGKAAIAARIAALTLAAVVTAVVMLPVVRLTGPLILVLLLAAPVGWHLVKRPDHALMTLLVLIVLMEDDSKAFLGQTGLFYEFLPGLPLQPLDLVLGCVTGGLVIGLVKERKPVHVHRWLWVPLPILTCALVWGAVVGYTSGGDLNTLLNSFRVFALLIVTPLAAAATAIRHRMLDSLLRWWFILVSVKALGGVASWLTGQGRAAGTSRITYYTPTMNQLTLIAVLGVLALALRFGRVQVNRWILAGAVASTLSLVLALRRSFWIGLILGVLLVLIIATGRQRRVWLLLGGALIMAGAGLVLSAGGATNSDNPVLQRAEIRNDAEDRYRLDEQANVFAEIERNPLKGIGLGVPWEAREPLSLEFESGRNYTHVAIFFFWLKLGPLGVLGYGALTMVTIGLGLRLWRLEQAHDRWLASAGLGIAIGQIALVVIELSGTFTGASSRFTVAMGLVIGWTAAAVLRSEERHRVEEANVVRALPPLPPTALAVPDLPAP